MNRLYRQQLINQNIESVFAFFEKPENLSLITPPWLNFRILNRKVVQMKEGATFGYKIKLHFFTTYWESLISDYKPPFFFSDEQIKGPYKYWKHNHKFILKGENTLMEDEVLYDVGWGIFGKLLHKIYVRKALEEIFNYRRQKVIENLKKI